MTTAGRRCVYCERRAEETKHWHGNAFYFQKLKHKSATTTQLEPFQNYSWSEKMSVNHGWDVKKGPTIAAFLMLHCSSSKHWCCFMPQFMWINSLPASEMSVSVLNMQNCSSGLPSTSSQLWIAFKLYLDTMKQVCLYTVQHTACTFFTPESIHKKKPSAWGQSL